MNTLHLYRAGKELPCFRWRFKAKNGRILAHGGESYKTRRAIVKALLIVFPDYIDGDTCFERSGPLLDKVIKIQDTTRRRKESR